MINPVADFLAMRREIAARSKVLDAWGFLLNVPTLLGGLVFLNEPVGATVAVSIVVSLVIASQMHKRKPMSRLIGLCHVVFVPAIVLLALEARSANAIAAYDIWVIYCLAMMSVCVLIDLFDLYRYFVHGNHTYTDHPQR